MRRSARLRSRGMRSRRARGVEAPGRRRVEHARHARARSEVSRGGSRGGRGPDRTVRRRVDLDGRSLGRLRRTRPRRDPIAGERSPSWGRSESSWRRSTARPRSGRSLAASWREREGSSPATGISVRPRRSRTPPGKVRPADWPPLAWEYVVTNRTQQLVLFGGVPFRSPARRRGARGDGRLRDAGR